MIRSDCKRRPARDLSSAPSSETLSPIAWARGLPPGQLACGATLIAAWGWAYWPTLVSLVQAWRSEADYSHGWLVAPLALYALWLRRDRFPTAATHWAWPGAVLILFSIALRVIGGLFYLGSVDGWSMLVYAAGVCWLLGGWPVCRWALPGIGLLFFMIPLPYRAEQLLRQPLQKIATQLSCWMLQFCGQGATAEANTIVLGNHRLEIAAACSGLRIFVTIAALAAAYVIFFRTAWWKRLLLTVSIIPIALFSNALRIVVTGLLYQYVGSAAGQKFSHDLAAWLMIPTAATMFAWVLWYLNRLFQEVELLDARQLLRERSG